MNDKLKQSSINQTDYKVDKSKEIIYLITTSVGESISESVGISWHCKYSGSYLLYKEEDNSEFIKVNPSEVYWNIEESYMDDSYQNKRYVCNVSLNNLESNRKYIYKVICDDIASYKMSFKTADASALRYSFYHLLIFSIATIK